MRKKLLIGIPSLVCVLLITLALLYFNGVFSFNYPSTVVYPVRGIDVSKYQGNIDWPVLSEQNIRFAFIKATEGSTFRDKMFLINWENANKTKLKVGAYHFFSYDSPGGTQADNFINAVPKQAESLPPVVDIEFYGDKDENIPDKVKTNKILDELLAKIEQHYNKKAILYVTKRTYDLYIKGAYNENPIWVRNTLAKPVLSDNRAWTFWQYSDNKILKGYKGEEKFIDMNLFNGSLEEFEKFASN
jgi:lysozyme